MNNSLTHLMTAAQAKSTTPKSKLRYRPVLSPEAILHILHLAKSEQPISPDSMAVIATLAPFQAKIENSGITPAYTTKPKEDLLSSLGGAAITSPADGADKLEYYAACFAKYEVNPTGCSLQEIAGATEHRYLNDLMSPEEEAVFESKQ